MMTEVTTFSRFIWGQLFKMGCFGSFFVWFEYKQMQWCVQRNMVCKWLLLKWLVLSTYFLNQQVKASYACQWAFLAPTYPREFWLGCSDYETHRQNRLQVSVVFFFPADSMFWVCTIEGLQSKSQSNWKYIGPNQRPTGGNQFPKVLWSHFICKFLVSLFPPGKRGTGSVRFWMEEMADMAMIPTLGCSRCMAYCDWLMVLPR